VLSLSKRKRKLLLMQLKRKNEWRNNMLTKSKMRKNDMIYMKVKNQLRNTLMRKSCQSREEAVVRRRELLSPSRGVGKSRGVDSRRTISMISRLILIQWC